MNQNRMLHIIEQFDQYAAEQNLSGGAILLWHKLYYMMSRKGYFIDVAQSTAVLTALLHITRQGLQQMRQSLVEKGFLAIRQDGHQQIFYTLLLNGKTIRAAETDSDETNYAGANRNGADGNATSNGESNGQQAELSEAARQAMQEPLAKPKYSWQNNWQNHADDFSRLANNLTGMVGQAGKAEQAEKEQAEKIVETDNAKQVETMKNVGETELKTGLKMESKYTTGDLMLTNQYRPYLAQFGERFGFHVERELLQWAEMRKRNGWTLTLWGLEAVLKNLVTLTEGNAVQMVKIVSQSIRRRWKGFFPLKVQAKPSGAKGIQLEKEEQKQNDWNRNEQARRNRPWQKFQPEGRDLSYLEF